jgi:hypothetical protein
MPYPGNTIPVSTSLNVLTASQVHNHLTLLITINNTKPSTSTTISTTTTLGNYSHHHHLPCCKHKWRCFSLYSRQIQVTGMMRDHNNPAPSMMKQGLRHREVFTLLHVFHRHPSKF